MIVVPGQGQVVEVDGVDKGNQGQVDGVDKGNQGQVDGVALTEDERKSMLKTVSAYHDDSAWFRVFITTTTS